MCAEACCRGCQGGGAGRDFERLEEPWVGPPGALSGGKDVQTQDVQTQDVCDTLHRECRIEQCILRCSLLLQPLRCKNASVLAHLGHFLHPVTNLRFGRGRGTRGHKRQTVYTAYSGKLRGPTRGRGASDTSVSANVSVLRTTPLTYPA